MSRYFTRTGGEITEAEWRLLRTDESCCVLAQYHRVWGTVTAAWTGCGCVTAPRHVYELSIDGGQYHGACLRASTEVGLIRAFDATVDAIKAHRRPPYWLDLQAVSA
jgi:hypothetical protein